MVEKQKVKGAKKKDGKLSAYCDVLCKVKQKLCCLWVFSKYVHKRINEDHLKGVAASLSYTSLLAVVPLFAIVLAVFAAFPVFAPMKEKLENLVYSNFVPSIGDSVSQYIHQFVGATGQLTTIGIAGLIFTAVALLMTIENSFNRIFHVRTKRPIFTRIPMYWTALTLGPLFIALSFSMSGYLFAIRNFFGSQAEIEMAISFVTQAVPTALMALTFALGYIIIPNKKVRFFDALIGAIIAAILFGALKHGFGIYVANAAVYKTVYGAMAILPLFLVWMYLSWLVVLFGAVITASIEDFQKD
ncbi:MAG: YihY family inner membrane protein [Alphaproteobacteria bacterium]|nr:YihY family inner membrane protein [Alphaproteobacteria bacterium]